ncbi:DNA adenine methylase [Acinetobacter baumannii]|uniref:DNA adenine methylase n=1 Tax=Acinetobacter baumannii TaxID=470 RepID=UPI000DF37E91|nr:DNA adenine methylase [Acinetobacter baumannii]RCT89661.1 DNA adenine methylase [Acinetobacter baumannii]
MEIKNYLGAKTGSGVYQAIINLIPPHDTYIELFLGTGAVLARKAKSSREIGIDLNNDCIEAFREEHPDVELYNMDAFEFINNFNFEKSGRTVIYCDPPYVLNTRTSDKRYKHELSDHDHVKLIQILKLLPSSCKVLLSGYRSNLYDELIPNWWSIDFQAMSRGGVKTETIWANFQPNEVHYHTYAGKDFTDRQRIKRKAERWASKFLNLPAPEKQAILASLLNAYDGNE